MATDEHPEPTAELVVTRHIDAPLARVWQAWHDPDLVRQWWGPHGFTCPVADMRFAVGLASLVCMRSPDGHDIYNTWTYRTIRPGERIEFDSRFAGPDRRHVEPAAIGLPAEIPDPVPHVVTFQSSDDGGTRLTVTEYGYTAGPVLELSKQGQEQCVEKLAAAVTSTPA